MRLVGFGTDQFMNLGAVILLFVWIFLLFIWIVAFCALFHRKKYIGTPKQVSLIVPVYNEERTLPDLIDSIARLRYRKEFLELLIVDDGSTDDSIAVANKHAKKTGIACRILETAHQGKSFALNHGIKAAKHDIVFCFDADVILDPDVLRQLVAPFREKDVAATNCAVFVKRRPGILNWFQRVEYIFNNLIRVSFSKLFNNSIWFFGAAACYRKSALRKVGYFKTDSMTEDMDMCLELYRSDFRIITLADARIHTIAPATISQLFNQRMRWYFGALQALIKNRKLLGHKGSIPVLFLFVNQFWWTFFAFVSFPLIAYQFWFWLPEGATEIAAYTFRWFSLSGPFYVFYKVPEWGLSILNIGGISAGITTMVLSLRAFVTFRRALTIPSIIAIFFYFPYTILLNAMVVMAVVKNSFRKRKYFID